MAGFANQPLILGVDPYAWKVNGKKSIKIVQMWIKILL